MPEENRLRWPWLTLSVIGLAIMTFFVPSWSAAFVYDREALAAAEMWRLWTGHLAHFSGRHLVFDLMAFGVSAAIVERLDGNRARGGILLAAGCLSAGLYGLEPELSRYGGLSGIATFTTLWAALCVLQRYPAYRLVGWAAVTLIFGKILVDSLVPDKVWISLSDGDVFKSPTSHLLGALLALVWSVRGRRSSLRR